MICVKAIERECQSVGLMELKGIVRLRLNIDSDNSETGSMIAHCRAASFAV